MKLISLLEPFRSLLGLKPLAPQPIAGGILRAVSTGDPWGGRTSRPVPPRRPEYDEQALIAAAQGGHLPAFNQIIMHYQGLAYNVAYRIMGDTDSAADATQDGFVKAYPAHRPVSRRVVQGLAAAHHHQHLL